MSNDTIDIAVEMEEMFDFMRDYSNIILNDKGSAVTRDGNLFSIFTIDFENFKGVARKYENKG